MEDYKKKYEEALEKAKSMMALPDDKAMIEEIFPELKESEDEQVRKDIVFYIAANHKDDGEKARWLYWLEKQGEKNKWKPSKDEMDALYGLSYITNKMDDKKDEAITKLYQDLKREFFDGASYENMFPSSPVDAPIKDEKQAEQKPAEKPVWYDNMDDLIAEGMIDEIQKSDLPEGSKHNRIYWINKHRVQPKQEWSEEDETIWGMFIEMADSEPDENFYGATKERCSSWLKSLKDRMQPKLEWSEEDGRCIRYLIECLEVCVKGTAIKMLPSTAQKYIEWLKSLRPQNTWKPSDYELEVLRLVAEKDGTCLMGLYEQLLKLREE